MIAFCLLFTTGLIWELIIPIQIYTGFSHPLGIEAKSIQSSTEKHCIKRKHVLHCDRDDWLASGSIRFKCLISSSFKTTFFFANSFQNWQIKKLNNGLQWSPLYFYFVTNVSFVQVSIFSSNLFYYLHKKKIWIYALIMYLLHYLPTFFLGSRRGRFKGYKIILVENIIISNNFVFSSRSWMNILSSSKPRIGNNRMTFPVIHISHI